MIYRPFQLVSRGRRLSRRMRIGRAQAYTLLEVVFSTLIISLVMTAAAGTLVLTSRAMDSCRTDPTTRASAARTASDRLAEDLKVATAISEQTATSITVTVPDRTGDGLPEVLRYAWSGAAGDPLTLSVNGQAPFAIASDVQAFDLKYLTRTVGKPPPGESAEQLLVIHDSMTGIKTVAIKNTTWIAECFLPAFPSNALSWKITRIKVQLKRANNSAVGLLTLQVRPSDASRKPTAVVLDSASVNVTAIPTSNTWVEFSFSGLSGLNPAKALCAVLTSPNSTSPGFGCYDSASTDATISYTSTTNTGGSWTAPTTTRAMQIYVYGTYTYQP